MTNTADEAGAVLDAIRARAEAATDGPWDADFIDEHGYGWTILRDDRIVTSLGEGSEAEGLADFIAHAREDVPRLLAAVDAVLGLTRDEWGSRTDDGERCSYCRHKWSKHHDGDDETHYRISDAINAHYRATVAAITEALTRKEEA